MKSFEAEELGFYYTGMSARANSHSWEEEKARAAKLKKMYKGVDYRVVDERCQTRFGSELWKNIYGNEIFRQVQYFNKEWTEKSLNNHQSRLDKLFEDYQKAVEHENKLYEETKKSYDFIMSIRKEVK